MPAADLLQPVRSSDRLGRYEVLLPIASGGMASVYLAVGVRVSGFERQVAIKLVHPHLQSDPDLIDSLLNEGKLATEIRHRNVVAVLDVGLDRRGTYLVMEYIEGDSLAALARAARAQGKRIPDAVVVRILTDALAGLHAAHELHDEQGKSLDVVHRDVSPQNILVSVEGNALLTDFGIAKATTRAGNTQTGIVKGKISYLSPEQVRLRPIDRRADVWAAGVVAWEMFAGCRLHPDGNQLGTLLEIVSKPPPLLRTIRPDISEAIESAVAGALQLDPDRRLPTAKALRDALLDACPSRTDIADIDEVGEFVQFAVGAKLRERRERVSKVLEIRSKLGRIARQAPVLEDSADDLIAIDPSIFPLPGAGSEQPRNPAPLRRSRPPGRRQWTFSGTFDSLLDSPALAEAASPPAPVVAAPSPTPPVAAAPTDVAVDTTTATADLPGAADPATDTVSVTRPQILRSRRWSTSLLALAGVVATLLVVMVLAARRGAAHVNDVEPARAAALESARAIDPQPSTDAPALQLSESASSASARLLTVNADTPMVGLKNAGTESENEASASQPVARPHEDVREARPTDARGRTSVRVPAGASTAHVQLVNPSKGPGRVPSTAPAVPLASDPY